MSSAEVSHRDATPAAAHIAANRLAKARRLAAALRASHITAADAQSAPPSFWQLTAEYLELASPPSAATISLTIALLEAGETNRAGREA